MWQADPEGVKILDVRTPEEWVFTGHAPMATNIPFAFLAYVWDDEKKAFAVVAEPRLRRARQAAVLAGGHAARYVPLRRPRGDGDQHAGGQQGSQRPTTSSTGWRAAGSTIPTASSTACAGRTAGRCRGCRGPTTSTPTGWRSPSARPGSSTPATPRTDDACGRRGSNPAALTDGETMVDDIGEILTGMETGATR